MLVQESNKVTRIAFAILVAKLVDLMINCKLDKVLGAPVQERYLQQE
jgi:hypothetical protein